MKLIKGDIPELKLKKSDGSEFDLKNLKGKKVYLKFMRFASCMFCNLEINNLKEKYNEFGKDFEIILVFHSKVDNLMEKMKRHGELPFTVVADPSYFYYKKYGLERSAIKFIKALILKFPLALSALLKGYIPLSIDGFIDIATADFFLDKNGVVLNAKYSVKDIFDGFKFEEIKQFSL